MLIVFPFCSMGEKLVLLDRTDSSWWKCSVGQRSGFVPANYCQEILPGEKVAQTTYEFAAEEEDELAFFANQIVIVTEDEQNGWLVGKIGDTFGAFPATYVTLLPS
jgi:hypothetical protein